MITNEIYFFKNQSSVSISDPLYNVNDGVLILQVDGNASNLELSVLGNTDLIDDDFIALKTINATDYSMSDKITSTGIYWIDINGIRKVKLNLSKITGSVNVKALTKRGLTTDLVARAMAANSQSGGCSLEEVKAITGELDNLSTEDKTNLVNAINEVASSGGLFPKDSCVYYLSGSLRYDSSMYVTDTEVLNNLSDIMTDYYPKYQQNSNLCCVIFCKDDTGASNGVFIVMQGRGTKFYYTYPYRPSYKHAYSKVFYLDIKGSWNETTQKYTVNSNTRVEEEIYTPTENNQLTTKKYVDDKTGDLTTLSTEDKSSLVNAINEIVNYREITELTDETVVISNLNAGAYKLTTSVKKIQYGTTIYNTAGYMDCIMLVENYRGTKKAYVFTNKTLYYFNGSGSYEKLEIVLSNISLIDKNETISGTKTFSSLPKSSVVPSDDTHLVNKKYVDDAIASAITTSLEASY